MDQVHYIFLEFKSHLIHLSKNVSLVEDVTAARQQVLSESCVFTHKKLQDGGEQSIKTSETVALGEPGYFEVKQLTL